MLLAGYALEPALPSLAAADAEAGHEESATAEGHSSGESHQATFRVRLSRQRVGPYLVDAFTGLTEVGDLFVEVGVRDPAGVVQEERQSSVEAAPADGTGSAVGGVATSAGAQVPGNYAIHLPVTSAGFWDVTLTIDGPLGHADRRVHRAGRRDGQHRHVGAGRRAAGGRTDFRVRLPADRRARFRACGRPLTSRIGPSYSPRANVKPQSRESPPMQRTASR